MSSPSPSSKNAVIKSIQFPDHSQYFGQVLEPDYAAPAPHGYGRMITKEGFEMLGYFKAGKAVGSGRFTAPNGDRFYGTWNDANKRDGSGVLIKSDSKASHEKFVETYENGQLIKRVKSAAPAKGSLLWKVPYHGLEVNAPCGRSGHSCSLLLDSSMMVVFGGLANVIDKSFDKGSRLTPLNDLHILDVQNKSWMSPVMKGKIPPPMYGHTATVVDDCYVYVIGGHMEGVELNSAVYVLDVRTGSWSCPIQKGIHFVDHTANLVGDRIVVIVQAIVYSLDLKKHIWAEEQTDTKALRFVPRSLVNHTAVTVGNMIYIHGGKILQKNMAGNEGREYQKCSSDLRILDTNTMCWSLPTVVPPEPSNDRGSVSGDALKAGKGADKSDYSGVNTGAWNLPRSEHSAVLVCDKKYGNKIYYFGGWTTSNPGLNVVDNSFLNDLHVLDVDSLEWTTVTVKNAPLSIPRSLHTAVLVGEEIWILGGRNHAMESMFELAVIKTGNPNPPPPVVKAPAATAAAGGVARAENVTSRDLSSVSASACTSVMSSSSLSGGGDAHPSQPPRQLVGSNKHSKWQRPVDTVQIATKRETYDGLSRKYDLADVKDEEGDNDAEDEGLVVGARSVLDAFRKM